jgi:hypothetical protein
MVPLSSIKMFSIDNRGDIIIGKDTEVSDWPHGQVKLPNLEDYENISGGEFDKIIDISASKKLKIVFTNWSDVSASKNLPVLRKCKKLSFTYRSESVKEEIIRLFPGFDSKMSNDYSQLLVLTKKPAAKKPKAKKPAAKKRKASSDSEMNALVAKIQKLL